MEEELEEIKDTMEKNDTVPGLLTDESGRPNDTGDLPRSPGPSVDVPSVVDEGLEVLNSREKNNIKHTKVDEFPNNWFTDNAQLVYIGECRSSNTVPSGYYLRHLGNEALSMRHCVIGTRGIHPFCVSMCSNIVITTLDLTDTWLSDECVPDLCLMFKENTTITNLNLSENRLSSKCAENLCDVLASSTQLEKLDLHQNLFDDGAAQFFGELIATSLKLAYINLSHNHLGSPSAIHIGRALPQANSLFDLDLSWNRLGGPGMKQFCKGLGENKYLKTLNLAANGLGPKVGCYELALALKLNKTLRSLELRLWKTNKGSMSSGGVGYLFPNDVIEIERTSDANYSTLLSKILNRLLTFSDNRISAEGSVLLSKGMYVNSTLNFLGMARNPMQTAGCYAILNGILKNSNCGLQELDLQDILVNDDFRTLQDDARIKLPKMIVRAGKYTTMKTRALSPSYQQDSCSPKEFLKVMGRCTKNTIAQLLRPYDTVGDKIVTRQVFVKVLYRIGVDLTEEEIKKLMRELDPENIEEVNFAEFELSQ